MQKTETWSDGVRRKWTEMDWTQDNEALPYQVNPRPSEIRAFDEAGNQRRVTIAYSSYGLPANVREYSGASVVRRRETQYRFDAGFVDRHILGVVWMELVYQGESTLVSKLNYHHDWSDPDAWNGQTPSTGHDTTNYGASFIWGRANVTGIRRHNLQAPNDDNQAVKLRIQHLCLTGAHQVAGEDGLVIMIARLGNGERRQELNRRRLHNARTFLTEFGHRDPETIVTAEGEGVDGYGRVELYVGGKLFHVLMNYPNADLPVGACSFEGDDPCTFEREKKLYPCLHRNRRGR